MATLGRLGSPDCFGLRVDLADPATIDAAFAAIDRRWGALNTLVNAAGPGAAQVTFEGISDEDWLAAYEIGALSAVRCTRAALPLLRKAQWARVVNVSAHSTKRQSARLAAYTAARLGKAERRGSGEGECAGDGGRTYAQRSENEEGGQQRARLPQ